MSEAVPLLRAGFCYFGFQAAEECVEFGDLGTGFCDKASCRGESVAYDEAWCTAMRTRLADIFANGADRFALDDLDIAGKASGNSFTLLTTVFVNFYRLHFGPLLPALHRGLALLIKASYMPIGVSVCIWDGCRIMGGGLFGFWTRRRGFLRKRCKWYWKKPSRYGSRF